MTAFGSDLSGSARELLLAMFGEALASVAPEQVVPRHLPPPPVGRTLVVGAGKAAAAMARAVEDHWPGAPDRLSGLVITRHGHGLPCRRIEVIEAGHPVPEQVGLEATRRILAEIRRLGPDDLLLCLISGGGSSLLPAPLPGITLADKQDLTRKLLVSGAPIGDINVVRKHLSAVKGGRLAAQAHHCRIETLIISDVPGDDPGLVASGPTLPDCSTAKDALDVLNRLAIPLPAHVAAVLADPSAETPKPGNPCFERSGHKIIASAQDALEAAARIARENGVMPLILGNAIEGEARDAAKVLGAIARQVAGFSQPAAPPCVLLSGGETTVTLRQDHRGRGGRNTEFLLALAIALGGKPCIHALSCDTDGIDGSENNAGAMIAPDSLEKAKRLGLDPLKSLSNNDAYGFFEAIGSLIVTGPTRTNVNDFRAILITGRG